MYNSGYYVHIHVDIDVSVYMYVLYCAPNLTPLAPCPQRLYPLCTCIVRCNAYIVYTNTNLVLHYSAYHYHGAGTQHIRNPGANGGHGFACRLFSLYTYGPAQSRSSSSSE